VSVAAAIRRKRQTDHCAEEKTFRARCHQSKLYEVTTVERPLESGAPTLLAADVEKVAERPTEADLSQ
jgi:hypothetical protein